MTDISNEKKEFEIEIAIKKVSLELNENIDLYNSTKNKKYKEKIIQLTIDRDNIYKNDKKTIKKYI